MPSAYAKGPVPWKVTRISGGSPHLILNSDGSGAVRYGGIWTDTTLAATLKVYDSDGTGNLTANQIHNIIALAANTLAKPADVGQELVNGLLIIHGSGLGGGKVYVYWR